MTEEERQFFLGQGALESPKDNRNVYVEEVLGAPEMPDEFFSPYLVAAYLKNGTNGQVGRNSCVMESADKVLESLSSWVVTPDDVLDGEVIGYLFDLINGKLSLKTAIAEKIENFSPEFGYRVAKSIDGIPNQSGTYIYMSGKVPLDYGICKESIYPSLSTNDTQVMQRTPSQIAYDNAKGYKIVRYGNTTKDFESYKLGIWGGNANIIVGGFPTGGGENLGVQPQKPPTTTPTFGHAVAFFGYDLNYRYAIGSWTKNYGLKLYLKIKNDPKFGQIFVRGTESDHVVCIEGCHQLGKEWFPTFAYSGVTFFDEKFSPELEDRIQMLKTMREDVSGRVFAIIGAQRFWVTPGGDKTTPYEIGRGKLWPDVAPDQVPEYSRPEIRQYPLGGVIGRPSWTEYLSILMGAI